MDAYRRHRLECAQGKDAPGTVYERHAHERTILYTISGKLILTLFDCEPPRVVELVPGSEFVISGGVEHSAVVGNEGWKWLAAWDPEEAKQYDEH